MNTFLGMSDIAFWGAVETGLIYALVAMGVYLSFRVLDFPDLTVDGSFPLGAAVCATMIVSGWDPWISTLGGFLAGAFAGFVTAFISVRFGVLHLLASILTMVALYSINLRIMSGSLKPIGGSDTVLTPFFEWGWPDYQIKPIFLVIVVLLVLVALGGFLRSEAGLAMRATGANARMAKANGVKPGWQTMMGIALSNALVGLAGGLFAQSNTGGDASLGAGTIVIGLAAVIIGETLLPSRRLFLTLLGCVIGSVLYRLAIQVALSADFIGLQASDLNLVTAALILAALVLPRYWRRIFA